MALASIAIAMSSCTSTTTGEDTRPPSTVVVGDSEPDEGRPDAPPTTTATTSIAPAVRPSTTRSGAGSVPESVAAPATGPSGLAVTVENASGKARIGVPVRIDGPVAALVSTDADGVARLEGPPGRYRLRIEPACTDVVHVQTGATAEVAVPEGAIVAGGLRVESRARFAPAGPTTYAAENGSLSYGRRWPIGVVHVVSFTIADRCSGQPAPQVDFGGFTFTGPPGLQVQQQAQRRTDDRGTAKLRVTCTAPADDLELVGTDRTDAADRIDLFGAGQLDDPPPSCVA